MPPKALIIAAAEILLVVTPMMWPQMPHRVGLMFYGLAVALLFVAALRWLYLNRRSAMATPEPLQSILRFETGQAAGRMIARVVTIEGRMLSAHVSTVTVVNTSNSVTAERVRVSAERYVNCAMPQYMMHLHQRLASELGSGEPDINPGDREHFAIYTLFRENAYKPCLGQFANGTFQPLDGGTFFVSVLASAKNSTPVYLTYKLDIDDGGYGEIGGLLIGDRLEEIRAALSQEHRSPPSREEETQP